MKNELCIVTGIAGSIVTGLFGGWSHTLTTLLIFMAVDFLSGLIVAMMEKSAKTNTGATSSKCCWWGLIKKLFTLIMVGVAHRLDIELGTDYIMNAVAIAFMVNELISLVENIGLMGVPMPPAIINAIEVLRQKSDEQR